MELGGYVFVYRKLLQSPIWTKLEPGVLKVMLACLLRAHWKASTWYDGAHQVEILRGSFITSYPNMATLCNLTQKQVRGAFSHLENAGFITCTKGWKWTLVTVLNYDSYQSNSLDFESENAQNIGQAFGQASGQGETVVAGQAESQSEGSHQGRHFVVIKPSVNSEIGKSESAVGQAVGQAENGLEGREKVDSRAGSRAGSRAPYEEERLKTTTNTCASDDARVCDGAPSKQVNRKQKKYPGMSPQQQQWFDAWWGIYWHRVAKKAGAVAFAARVTTEVLFERVMAATRAQSTAMLKRDEEKRPYPATWINGERWEDEAVEAKTPQPATDMYTTWEPPAAREA